MCTECVQGEHREFDFDDYATYGGQTLFCPMKDDRKGFDHSRMVSYDTEKDHTKAMLIEAGIVSVAITHLFRGSNSRSLTDMGVPEDQKAMLGVWDLRDRMRTHYTGLGLPRQAMMAAAGYEKHGKFESYDCTRANVSTLEDLEHQIFPWLEELEAKVDPAAIAAMAPELRNAFKPQSATQFFKTMKWLRTVLLQVQSRRYDS